MYETAYVILITAGVAILALIVIDVLTQISETNQNVKTLLARIPPAEEESDLERDRR